MAKLIGTAGHVDHGKTSLIRALTGIDADRLPEEKERGLTIDIGFAHIELPGIGQASIVDVPGHERFVSNMLVGALGIDVALLCVAADESVMRQTREHFEILTLLPVEKLIVAITKVDAVDKDTLEIAKLEVTELLEPTRFKGSPLVPVSSITGEGLEDLKSRLATALQSGPAELDKPWYLPIDRVFTIKGHGTVVTGTLMQGVVKEGDEVQIEPGGFRARVRQIQGHDSALIQREQGQRTALNLGGLKQEEVERGMLAAAPGTVFETSVVDAKIEWHSLPKHGLRVRVAIGSDEAIGKVFLNDNDPTLAQFRFERPTAAVAGQPVVVRRYSPPDVLGGGRVTVPLAAVRTKRETVKSAKGSDMLTIIANLVAESPKGVLTDDVCRTVGRSVQTLGDVFQTLLSEGRVLGFAGLWITPENFETALKALKDTLHELHDQNPSKLLFLRESTVQRAGLRWQGKPLDRIIAYLVEQGLVQSAASGIGLSERASRLNPAQRQLLDRVKSHLELAGWSVPNPRDVATQMSLPIQAVEAILRLGIEIGEIVRLDEGIWYTNSQMAGIQEKARAALGGRSFTASEFRDVVGTSRKFAIPILEHFDARRVTFRQGDNRVFVQVN